MNKLLPTKKAESIISAIEIFAEKKPDAIALLAPGEPSVTYGELFESITGIQHFLSSKGLGREDRVALLLPNGIEMALMFLGILANSVAAPLNPAYKIKGSPFTASLTSSRAGKATSQKPQEARAMDRFLCLRELIRQSSCTLPVQPLPQRAFPYRMPISWQALPTSPNP
jgi:acyl-CoA synthetase (AMP-forming)/AMP-acid ligase II